MVKKTEKPFFKIILDRVSRKEAVPKRKKYPPDIFPSPFGKIPDILKILKESKDMLDELRKLSQRLDRLTKGIIFLTIFISVDALLTVILESGKHPLIAVISILITIILVIFLIIILEKDAILNFRERILKR